MNTPTLADLVEPPRHEPSGSPLEEPTFKECCAEWLRYYEARKAGMDIDPDHTGYEARPYNLSSSSHFTKITS